MNVMISTEIKKGERRKEGERERGKKKEKEIADNNQHHIILRSKLWYW